ncbi:ribonuclease H2, subunit C [Amanita rubescens]|nr:ribonuclease H2, subunit C [Amanita rubescens]
MPFHIGYSGPAPISTYMHVEPSPGTIGAPPKKAKQDDNDGSSAPAMQTEDNGEKVVESLGEENDASQTSRNGAGDLTPNSIESGDARRHISTFRGRTIHGLDIDLPEGYTGLVLRTEGQGISNNSVGSSRDRRHRDYPKATVKRVTRRSKTTVTRDEDGEVELEMSEKVVQRVECMDLTEDVERDVDEYVPTRVLIPTAQFSSFRLWSADIPVNEGTDEYSRSLTEWIRLAHHIHQIPP